MKFSSNTTNVLFSLLIFGNIVHSANGDEDCPSMEEIDQSILDFLENEAGLDCSDKKSIGPGFNEFICTQSIPMATVTYSSITTGSPDTFSIVGGAASSIKIQDPCNALNEVKDHYNYSTGADDTPTNTPTNAPNEDEDCPSMEEIDQSVLDFLENGAGLDCADKKSIGPGFNEFICTQSIPMATVTYSSITTGSPDTFSIVGGAASSIKIQDPCNALNEVKDHYNYSTGADDTNTPTNTPTNAPNEDKDCPSMEEIDQSILDFLENEAGLDCSDNTSIGLGFNEFICTQSIPMATVTYSSITTGFPDTFSIVGGAASSIKITIQDPCNALNEVKDLYNYSTGIDDTPTNVSKSDVSTSGDANTIISTGGVAALDTGSSTATTNTVTIAASVVVVVASAIITLM